MFPNLLGQKAFYQWYYTCMNARNGGWKEMKRASIIAELLEQANTEELRLIYIFIYNLLHG